MPENDQPDPTTQQPLPDDALGTSQELQVRNPYDVAEPETLRERIAYAKALAQAGILPRDYAAKPANVLVAGELGRELGLTTVQSVLMLNVVEGRPTLGASGVRGVILRAGHRIKVTDRQHNKHGIPTSVTVTGWRYDDAGSAEPTDTDTRTYTLAMAKQAGLVALLHDDDGEVRAVRARSQRDNPLPWELHTERMLEARATTWLGDTLFADVTMGLSTDGPTQDPIMVDSTREDAPPKAEPTPRAAQVLDRIKPTRRTDLDDGYTPDADLAEAGPEWWQHAGAQVSRRSKVQLAADRLAKWVTDNDGQDQVPLPPAPEPALPYAAEPGGAAPHDDPAAPPAELEGDDVPDDAEPTDVVDAVVVDDPEVPDPGDGNDPWVGGTPADDAPADPVPADTLGRSATAMPTDPVPDDTQGHDALPQDTVPDDGPDLGDVPDLAPEPATAAELLAEIDEAAELLGKSRAGLMVRWIATHRKNPEDATAEELLGFVEQLRPTVEAKRQQ